MTTWWRDRLIAIAACALAPVAAGADPLVQGFQAPPDAAKPRVWWHWMDGNVTGEGVKLDLEWMKRVGIGGVQNFDAALNTPQVVDKRIAYLTPEWRHALDRAVRLADRLQLEFVIAGAPGWSETGGPWVKPEQAMKKLVWSEAYVDGGARFEGRIARPPAVTGSFQSIPLAATYESSGEVKTPQYYADAAVIAYRATQSDVPLASLRPVVTSSAGPIDAARLWDGDLVRTVSLPLTQSGTSWIQFSFKAPQRVQALTAVIGRLREFGPLKGAGPPARLEVSTDGRTFRKIIDLPREGAVQQTVSFEPTSARIFRVVLEQPPARTGLEEVRRLAAVAKVPPPEEQPTSHEIAELVLHGAPRVHRFEDKAGWQGTTQDTGAGTFYIVRPIGDADRTSDVAARDAIAKADVIDLTGKMRPDGSLDWTPPAGRWVVLRLGYSLTGSANHPASAEATGLEVDKLNRTHVKAYLDAYLRIYEQSLGADMMGRRGLQYMLTDSWEAGTLNWTDDMLTEFRQRRGYDPLPWLPVLTGRVVASAAQSDRFLWDFRKTIGDLIADEHYGQIAASLHERGMRHYGEAHENSRFFVGDGMDVKKNTDVPMGAKWAGLIPGHTPQVHDADLRETASVAHVYGQNIAAAESFTAFGNPYGFAPEMLKPIADRILAMGVNRFVISSSVHQPRTEPGPGLGLGPFGQYFTRRETWAEQAAPWISYLTRSSYLLQQGRFVADVAYLYGEDTNITTLFRNGLPRMPPGYSFDFVNGGALVDALSIVDGRLVSRGGTEYRLLALDPSTRSMSLPVLRRIREIVRAGPIVVGAKPVATPSLADDEEEFRAIVDELWGKGQDVRGVDSGKVFPSDSLAHVLRTLGVPPDVTFADEATGADLQYVHRALGDGDLYFISNRSARKQTVDASFRVVGDKAPQLWRADSGTIEPLSYRIEADRTRVPLRLEPNDAVFVVFREPATDKVRVLPKRTSQPLTVLEGPWDVHFPPDLGAPDRARFEHLESWTAHADAGVKYFSGTATYSKTIQVPAAWLKGGTVELDLGDVKHLAEVIVNGRSIGVLWKAPFKTDITDALQTGRNQLEIRVTNLWPNRLIGDKQPGARQIASAAYDPFTASSALLPSGLLGPVALSKVSPR